MNEQKQSIRIQCSNQLGPDRFEILFIKSGEANGYTFSEQVLKDSSALWESCSVFVDHAFWDRKVRDLGGVIERVSWSIQHSGLTAELTATGPSKEIVIEAARTMLSDGAHPDLGFSADLIFKRDTKGNVTQIMQPLSVDLVIDPAFATKFIRQLNQKGVHMPKPVRLKAQTVPPEDGDEDLDDRQNDERQTNSTPANDRIQESLQILDQHILNVQLNDCDLPEKAKSAIRTSFKNRSVVPSEVQEAIQAYREVLAGETAAAGIVGPSRVHAMFDSGDQVQAAIDDLVNAPRAKGAENLQVAKLSGIKEAYLMLTGDRDFVGGYFKDRVQFQHTTANFPGLVTNALNKALLNEWAQLGRAGYDWWTKITKVEHFSNLNDITWLIFGTIASLPTVTEGSEYTELKIGDGKETSSFLKKGGYVGITLEAIDRDDTRKLRAIPRELANAGLREISALVAAVFTDNAKIGPTMADGGALFNNTAVTAATGHANLLTTALGTDYVAWNAVALAMYAQPMLVSHEASYYGTGKQMAVEPRYCLIPRALKGAADALFVPRWASQVQTIATSGGPTYGGMVEPIVVPEWTNAADWAAVVDPAIVPGIMIGERFGLVPQIFVAGSESDPAMFSNDESRIKVRHFITVGVADFRPLHKNNI